MFGLAHRAVLFAPLNKLDAVLAQTSTSSQDAALFAELLSLPNDGRYPALELAPEQRRQNAQASLELKAVAVNPSLCVFSRARARAAPRPSVSIRRRRHQAIG